MKFIMSQNCDHIVPTDRVVRIYIDYNERKELYYIKVLITVDNRNNDIISYVFGTFKTEARAEDAMVILMKVLEDEFWAKVADDK